MITGVENRLQTRALRQQLWRAVLQQPLGFALNDPEQVSQLVLKRSGQPQRATVSSGSAFRRSRALVWRFPCSLAVRTAQADASLLDDEVLHLDRATIRARCLTAYP